MMKVLGLHLILLHKMAAIFNGTGRSTTNGRSKIPTSGTRLFFVFLFPWKVSVGNGFRGHIVHGSPLRTPTNMTGTTFGILCWSFSVTRVLAYSQKRYLMKKIRGESHFLVISQWTSHSTKNELVSEEEARYWLMSQTCQARIGNDGTCA